MKRLKIPSELRRKILVEAGHRCAIPTCRTVVSIDVHHIIPWSKCKKHEYSNLIALCPNCHRLAEKGEIDRSSLRMYKNNLRFLYDKFTVFEIDLLFELYKLKPEEKIQFLPFLRLFIKRILEAGYVDYETTMARVALGDLKINPDLVKITTSGRNFIKDLFSKNVGY